MATTKSDGIYDDDYVTVRQLNETLDEEIPEAGVNYSNNFNITPTTPYYVGDTWTTGSEFYVCKTERLIGSYVSTDWELSTDYTSDAALTAFIASDYSDFKDATDSIVSLYYQSLDPEVDWDTYLKKSVHVGDLWKSKDTEITYIYTATGDDPVVYSWELADASVGLFDEIDGKKSVYSIQPSEYYEGDIWIINEGVENLPDELLTGDMAIANTSSKTFDWSHWNKLDNYIQRSVVDEELEPINASLIEVINDLDLNVSSSKLSKIIQTISDLSASFEIKGGANIIPNSVLVLDTSDSDEFTKTGIWSTSQSQDVSNNTVSKFLAQCTSAGKLTWNISVIPNTAFTLSMIYNNTLGENTTVKLTNGTEETLIDASTDIEYEHYEYGFVSNSNTIAIEIETDGTNFSYSDLMLNYGALLSDGVYSANALKWQPAQGETLGSNTRLSYEGAAFTMLGGTLKLYIDNSGMRIVKLSDESIISDFDADGINVLELRATSLVSIGEFGFKILDSNNMIEY